MDTEERLSLAAFVVTVAFLAAVVWYFAPIVLGASHLSILTSP